MSAGVASPCISVCTLDASQTYCTGCLRTLGEIARWGTMGDGERRALVEALPARRDALAAGADPAGIAAGRTTA